MKRAVVIVQAVSVDCPHCGDPLPEPADGSLTWEAGQIHAGQVIHCRGCSKSCVLPALGKKVKV